MADNTIIIYKRIPSQNEFVGRHWRKKNGDRLNWQIYLLSAISRRYDPPNELRQVKIVSYRNRILDVGNLIGGAKGLVDAIVNVGLLYDDRPEWAKIEYEQIKTPRVDERTEITIQGWVPLWPITEAGKPRHQGGQ